MPIGAEIKTAFPSGLLYHQGVGNVPSKRMDVEDFPRPHGTALSTYKVLINRRSFQENHLRNESGVELMGE